MIGKDATNTNQYGVNKMPKITPKLTPDKGVDFTTLNEGDCFLLRGDLWQKSMKDGDQLAQCLSDGEIEADLCGTTVVPADVEIKWTKQKK